MNDAARKVADSVMMTALARLAVLIGTPAMLMLLAWFAGNFIALQQLSAVQAAEQTRLVLDVRELQDYRRDAYARGQAMAKELAAIRDQLARIETRLDRQGRN